MLRTVWEALENNGGGVVTDWDIPPEQAGKLESKLDLLRAAEVDGSGRVNLPHKLLAGPGVFKQKWIYKLLINGKQALRPMLCLGPADREGQWTVLARATEKNNDTAPQKAAAATAAKRRGEVLSGARKRRVYLG